MTDIWDAKIYRQFLDLRTRPARDLLSAIPNGFEPKQVYDLGCGPGNSTILLKERWPSAEIIGIDSSKDMINEAKATHPNIHFTLGNIADFSPPGKIDCLFANASLQWLGRHEILIPQLLGHLNFGGVMAIQLPNNFHSPTHQVTIQLLQNNIAWQTHLKNLFHGSLKNPLYQAPWYYDLLSDSGAKNIQIWETDYFQEIADHQGIFDWVKGTGLRPVLTKMDADNQAIFSKAYIEAISKEYPLQSNGKVLLPYKRMFIVGFK
jgi:trans-aconitate 2-methyltransferase